MAKSSLNSVLSFVLLKIFALTDGTIAVSQSLTIGEVAPQVRIPVTIDLRPSAVVRSSVVFLSDVADCKSEIDICSEAYAIEVDVAPSLGAKRSIRLRRLRTILTQEWPTADIRFIGAKLVVVSVESIKIPSEDALPALSKSVEKLGQKEEDLRFKLVKVISPRFVVVPYESGKFVCGEASRPLRGGLASIGCHYQHGSSRTQLMKFRVSIERQRRNWVLAMSLKRGDLFTSDAAKKKWIKEQKHYIHEEPSLFHGYVARRNIPKDSLLRASMFAPNVICRRGDLVDLVVKHGSLTVVSKAKIQKSGSLGEIVEVRPINSSELVQARIVDRRSVVALK